MSCVNGAVPTTIIVAGLALAGYALLMTALNRRMGVILLAALGVLEILLLVLVGIIVAKLVGGGRPAGLATLIGYLIAMPLVPRGRRVLGAAGAITVGPGGHRRGRARRGRADGPVASDLAGHPCLSRRPSSRQAEPTASRPGSTRTGPGRVLIAVYALFRAVRLRAGRGADRDEVRRRPGRLLVVGLRRRGLHPRHGHPRRRQPNRTPDRRHLLHGGTRRRALAIGTWSLVDPATFPDATVWSGYGTGYGYVPLVLPVFGLLWLRHWARRGRARSLRQRETHATRQAAAKTMVSQDGHITRAHPADRKCLRAGAGRYPRADLPVAAWHLTRTRARESRFSRAARQPRTGNPVQVTVGSARPARCSQRNRLTSRRDVLHSDHVSSVV